MAQCKQPVTISTIYECATFCDKWNTPPIPKFVFERNMLIQKCDFFDSGIIQNRLFKWEFRCDGYFFSVPSRDLSTSRGFSMRRVYHPTFSTHCRDCTFRID
jgi:hypothetical protein